MAPEEVRAKTGVPQRFFVSRVLARSRVPRINLEAREAIAICLEKTAAAKVLKLDKVKADTTIVEANVSYPTDSGLLARAIARIACLIIAIHAAGGATRINSHRPPARPATSVEAC